MMAWESPFTLDLANDSNNLVWKMLPTTQSKKSRAMKLKQGFMPQLFCDDLYQSVKQLITSGGEDLILI